MKLRRTRFDMMDDAIQIMISQCHHFYMEQYYDRALGRRFGVVGKISNEEN